jgi:hypothetical protein
VHRDLKPGNIWLEGRQRRVKILDLGIVRHTRDESLTLTGEVLGTPGFMSPEQARGDHVDARSDLFSLGCILYTLCTGIRPFTGNSSMAVLTALAVDKPSPIRERSPHIPQPLADLIMELLAKQADMRPQSAEEVLDRLGQMAETSVEAVAEQDEPREWTSQTIPDTRRSRGHRTERRRRVPYGELVLVAVAGLAALSLVVLAAIWLLKSPRAVDDHPVTYLTDLKEVARENWPFRLLPGGPKGPKQGPKGPPPGEKGPPPGEKGPKGPPPGEKGPPPREKLPPPPAPDSEVRVKGVVAAHGIHMHPPGEDQEGKPASLSYSLGKAYQVFQAEVTFNDGPVRSETPCTFFVYGDGRLLWKSTPVSSQADAQQCQVSVEDVDILRIVVICPGSPRGAHAVWVDPRVIK